MGIQSVPCIFIIVVPASEFVVVADAVAAILEDGVILGRVQVGTSTGLARGVRRLSLGGRGPGNIEKKAFR